MVADHEDQAILRTLVSDYLPNGHHAAEGLEYTDFRHFRLTRITN